MPNIMAPNYGIMFPRYSQLQCLFYYTNVLSWYGESNIGKIVLHKGKNVLWGQSSDMVLIAKIYSPKLFLVQKSILFNWVVSVIY